MLFTQTANDVISVSSLNRLARDLLESGLAPTWIGGEISNLTLAASGHGYFSLKDASAQVRCVMFRQRLSLLPFRLSNGMQVELKGVVTIYEARGDFQINVDTMRAAGLGRLFEAFERLKAALSAEGLFAAERKRPLPNFPRAIGIVTSPAAAALRDVVSTLERRMPGINLILYPTPVQGEGSAQQIAQAIRQASQRQEVDLLIVCRGGGSIEDLWSFNEEVVARAIVAAPMPVISGVGHETDFTICDFVADLRAPTPTAAAEMASPSREQLQVRLTHGQHALQRALARCLSNKGQHLDQLTHRLRHPGERLTQQKQILAHHSQRLGQLLNARIDQARWRLQLVTTRVQNNRPDLRQPSLRLEQLRLGLARGIKQQLQVRQTRLERAQAALAAISPEAVLERGYAIVQNRQGVAIKSASDLAQGERVTLRLSHGHTDALIDHAAGAQPKLPF
jgi:exodeoxyribonuclease VII large subunit